MPEVIDCFSVSGDADYMLRIVVPDLAAFSELMMKQPAAACPALPESRPALPCRR
jgi:DNA-binding Lrp family transcriptional regulator